MRHGKDGNDADRRLPIFLRMYWLWHQAAAQERRLLRVLLLRIYALSAEASRARRQLLHEVSCIVRAAVEPCRDWLANTSNSLPAVRSCAPRWAERPTLPLRPSVKARQSSTASTTAIGNPVHASVALGRSGEPDEKNTTSSQPGRCRSAAIARFCRSGRNMRCSRRCTSFRSLELSPNRACRARLWSAPQLKPQRWFVLSCRPPEGIESASVRRMVLCVFARAKRRWCCVLHDAQKRKLKSKN